MDPLDRRIPMVTESPSPSRKRTASTLSTPTTSTSSAPIILHRHHHRRTNIAAQIWGLEIPITPSSSFTSSHPASTSSSSTSTTFNIYKSLLRHPSLFFQFTLRLPLDLALSLYAIDKEFHYLFNKYYVSLIHDYARYHCPLASHIFSWSAYPELCISDPMLRPMNSREWLARDVPGWRWVGMVMERQKLVRGILTDLAVQGHRVPASTEAALYKFWVVMECKTSAMRLAYLQDRGIWRDADIRNFQLFLVKLDMRFTCPILGNGSASLSHLLLSQKSLSTLYYVLIGEIRLTYDTTTDMVIRTYLTEELDTDTFPWIDDEVDNGVPEEYWGILMKERWDAEGARMESAVDMVISEGIRRELHVQQHLLDFVLYGHVDDEGRNAPVVRRWRGDKKVVEKEGWPGKGVREEVIKDLDERLGIVKSGGGRDAMDVMDLSIQDLDRWRETDDD